MRSLKISKNFFASHIIRCQHVSLWPFSEKNGEMVLLVLFFCSTLNSFKSFFTIIIPTNSPPFNDSMLLIIIETLKCSYSVGLWLTIHGRNTPSCPCFEITLRTHNILVRFRTCTDGFRLAKSWFKVMFLLLQQTLKLYLQVCKYNFLYISNL